MSLKENMLKRLRQMLEMLSTGDEVFDLKDFFQHFATDFQVPILTLDDLNYSTSRVFSLWEQAFISQEARTFLLVALHTKTITSAELEETLALLFTQLQGFADLQQVRGILGSVVEEPNRNAMLALLDIDYVH